MSSLFYMKRKSLKLQIIKLDMENKIQLLMTIWPLMNFLAEFMDIAAVQMQKQNYK